MKAIFSRGNLPYFGAVLALVVAVILVPRAIRDAATVRGPSTTPRALSDVHPTLRTAAKSQSDRIESVYVAGPLFSAAERQFNTRLARSLRQAGYSVSLPQEIADPIAKAKKPGWQQQVFRLEVESLRSSRAVLCILDGADVDSGTAWEVGVAYQLHRPIVGLRTDFRTLGSEGRVNLMIQEACSGIVFDERAAIEALKRALGGTSHG